jgi:hypothetical protein
VIESVLSGNMAIVPSICRISEDEYMRLTAAILLTLSLASGTAVLHAAEIEELYLDQCKAQVSQRYGAGHEVKLVSMRRSGNGASIKLAVRLDIGEAASERVEFTTCRVRRSVGDSGSVEPVATLSSALDKEVQ